MNNIVIKFLKKCDFGTNIEKSKKNYIVKIMELINFFKCENDLKILNDYYTCLIEDRYNNLDDFESDLKASIINDILKFYMFYSDGNELNNFIYELYLGIDKAMHLSRVKYNQETDSYKVYPNFNLNDDIFGINYKEELKYILDIYFSHDKGIYELFSIVKETLNKESNVMINDIKNRTLKLYCGNTGFMMERSKYILECIEKILLSENVNDSIKNQFKKCYSIIKDLVSGIIVNCEMLNDSLDSEKYELYDEIEEKYKLVLQYEELLSDSMQVIWDDYLTNVLQYNQGEPFRFITHTLTGGYVADNEMNKACCTLVTNECIPIPFGDYGYIMEFDIKNIGTMCNEDAGSWLTSKDEFIERLFPDRWQMYEMIGDKYVWYEYPKLCKLILPWDMERQMYKQNQNGNVRYTEIIMKSTDKPLISSAFFAINEDGKKSVKKIISENNIEKPLLCLNQYSYSKK